LSQNKNSIPNTKWSKINAKPKDRDRLEEKNRQAGMRMGVGTLLRSIGWG